MTDTGSAEDFIPLKPLVLHILLSIAETPRHGYGIIRDLRERTDGAIEVHTGPLYRHLRRLLDEGLVDDTDEPPEGTDDDARRGSYYHISPLGRDVLALEMRRLDDVLTMGRELGVA